MTKLLEPIKIGGLPLQHRIVMAPLTRLRNNDERVPQALMLEYYTQRAVEPGTLIISEATSISPQSSGWINSPGIWSSEQIAEWKKITEAVHAKGCYVYCQLFAMGRAATSDMLKAGGYHPVSSSASQLSPEHLVPHALTEEQIWEYVGDFAQGAKNAIEAGFDGVEIHGANGYLVDQFNQSTCNKRTDAWGGSPEKRARFALEVMKAVSAAIGADRVAMRLSPFSLFQGMKMAEPIKEFTPLVEGLKELKLAYLHLIEGRISGAQEFESSPEHEQLKPLIEIWGKTSPLLIAGGFTPERARQAVDVQLAGHEAAIVFGRHFIANPDLVFRIREGLALDKYDREKFYKAKSPEGYIDYPYSKEFEARRSAIKAH